MLETFQKKVEQVAESYADLVLSKIKDTQTAQKMTPEIMGQVNEGIRMLNQVANTLERINRIQAEPHVCGEAKD